MSRRQRTTSNPGAVDGKQVRWRGALAVTKADLSGWTHTGSPRSRGKATALMPDGTPNWSLPAHEPDNGPRAVAGRILALVAVYAFGLTLSGAGLWLTHQPGSQDATAALIQAMPGPGPIWQTIQALALFALAIALTAWLAAPARTRHRHRRVHSTRPARVPAAYGPQTRTGWPAEHRHGPTSGPARPVKVVVSVVSVARADWGTGLERRATAQPARVTEPDRRSQ